VSQRVRKRASAPSWSREPLDLRHQFVRLTGLVQVAQADGRVEPQDAKIAWRPGRQDVRLCLMQGREGALIGLHLFECGRLVQEDGSLPLYRTEPESLVVQRDRFRETPLFAA
jgi:hypothetical protein